MKLDRVPAGVWGVLFVALLLSIKPMKNADDSWQLESMLVNNEPETWRDQCLVKAYRDFTAFKSSFEHSLKSHNDSFMSRMKEWEVRRANEPTILDHEKYEGLDEFFDAHYAHMRNGLKEDTAHSKKVSFTLYDGYREYCLSEAACFTGEYQHYTYCMRNGPRWSLSGWEYPIMWNLEN